MHPPRAWVDVRCTVFVRAEQRGCDIAAGFCYHVIVVEPRNDDEFPPTRYRYLMSDAGPHSRRCHTASHSKPYLLLVECPVPVRHVHGSQSDAGSSCPISFVRSSRVRVWCRYCCLMWRERLHQKRWQLIDGGIAA